MKKQQKKVRNWLAVHAHFRKGGKMDSKKDYKREKVDIELEISDEDKKVVEDNKNESN
jgi:hypothetical protein